MEVLGRRMYPAQASLDLEHVHGVSAAAHSIVVAGACHRTNGLPVFGKVAVPLSTEASVCARTEAVCGGLVMDTGDGCYDVILEGTHQRSVVVPER